MRGPSRSATLWAMQHPPVLCPGCGAPVAAAPPGTHRVCGRCRLPLEGPLAAELWTVDRALADLDQRRAGLVRRRAELIDALRLSVVWQPHVTVPPPPVAPTGPNRPTGPTGPTGPAGRPAGPGWQGGPGGPGGPVGQGWATPVPKPERDASPPTVQNMLLALGGILLGVAAVVFTVVSWGRMGIGGRAAVLLALTAVAMAVPVPLVRRRLTATAEAIAGLGLMLALLDCFAARAAGLAGLDAVDGLRYWAVCLAVIAGGWAVYGRAVGLRSGPAVALLIAQLPAPLFAASVSDSSFSVSVSLIVTAGLNTAVGLTAGAERPEVRGIAATAGVATGLVSLVLSLHLVSTVPSTADAVRAAALLAAAAALATTAAYRLARAAEAASAEGRSGVHGSAHPAHPARADGTADATADAASHTGPAPGSAGGPADPRLADATPGTPDDSARPHTTPQPMPGFGPIGSGTPFAAPGGPHGTPAAQLDPLAFPAVLAALAAGAVVGAAGGVARTLLVPGWEVIGYLLAALAVITAASVAASGRYLPRPLPGGFAAAGAAAHACTVLWALPALMTAVFAPLGWADAVWSGAPATARAALGPEVAWQGSPAVPAVLALTALALGLAAHRLGTATGRTATDPTATGPSPTDRYRTPVRCAALAFAVATAAVLPVAADLPYTIAVLELVAVVGVLLAAAAALPSPPAARTALASAVVVATVAAGWALAEQPVTFVALGLLFALFAGTALSIDEPLPRATATAAAVATAVGLAWASPAALGEPAHRVAFAVLGVRAGCLALAAWPRVRGTAPVTVLDLAGTAATVVALVLALGHPEAALVAVLAGLLAVGAALLRRGDWRSGAVAEAGFLAGLAPLLIAESFFGALLRPYLWLREPWTGLAETARSVPRDWAAGPVPVPGLLAAVVVLAAVAAVLTALVAGGRGWALRLACVSAPVVLVAVPVGLGLPYPLTLAATVAGVGALFWVAARWTGGTAECAVACGLLLSLTSAAWSLAGRPETLTVLAALALAAACCAWQARSPSVRAAAAAAAVLASAAWSGAVTLAAGQPVAHAAFPVLAVAGATVPVAARLRAQPAGKAVEVAGYTAAATAVTLTADRTGLLALSLALAGVLALGVSVRADRRRAAYVGTVLLIVASWIRLMEWSVHSPEAYTLPVTVPALLVGWLRRREDPSVSSWAAYGTGLSVTLVPSLVAAWGDQDWPRPLLLGVCALVVTLAGAHYRLQAPLLLGGGVLALDALHELAPAVMVVVDQLPRWVPLGLAGALLLAVGATYEHRLRDVRRLRESLGRMR